MSQDSQEYWFRRKWYGWGWTPVTWQGWLATLCYAGALITMFELSDANSHSNSDTLIHFALPFIFISALFIMITRAKGEWPPKWQWGRPKDIQE